MEFPSQGVQPAAQRLQSRLTADYPQREEFARTLERICREIGVRSATLFLRELSTAGAGFVRVAAVATEAGAAPTQVLPPPHLPENAFLLRRLRRLSGPLCIEPEDLRAWERAVEANAVPGDDAALESRRAEVDLLRASRASLAALVCLNGEVLGVLLLGPRETLAAVNGARGAHSASFADRGAESHALNAACRELARLAKSSGLS